MKTVDRGGLVHVHDSVHKLFSNMERIVRSNFRKDKASDLPNQLRDSILHSVLKDRNVISSWTDVGVEIVEKDKVIC